MTKQEEIRKGIARVVASQSHTLPKFRRTLKWESLLPAETEHCLLIADQILECEASQGVVIKVERELPYKWDVITRKHSYSPYKKFTTYALRNKGGKMFGYIQKYQSLTGYKCFEKPVYFSIYLGNEECAHSYKSAPALKKAKQILIEQFLSSKDNPDNEIPAGYVAVEPLIKGS